MAILRNAKIDFVLVATSMLLSLVLMTVLSAQDEWKYAHTCVPAREGGAWADAGPCTLDPGPDPWCRSEDPQDPCGNNTSTAYGGYCTFDLRRDQDGCIVVELDLIITYTYPAGCEPVGDDDCNCVEGEPYGATDNFVDQCTSGPN